jgi:hypothetical protein
VKRSDFFSRERAKRMQNGSDFFASFCFEAKFFFAKPSHPTLGTGCGRGNYPFQGDFGNSSILTSAGDCMSWLI